MMVNKKGQLEVSHLVLKQLGHEAAKLVNALTVRISVANGVLSAESESPPFPGHLPRSFRPSDCDDPEGNIWDTFRQA